LETIYTDFSKFIHLIEKIESIYLSFTRYGQPILIIGRLIDSIQFHLMVILYGEKLFYWFIGQSKSSKPNIERMKMQPKCYYCCIA